MAEYIKREDVLSIINTSIFDLEYNSENIALQEEIKLIPAADVVERKSCNTCQYYEGVHNAAGIAPCSFWNIGAVMWNDFCSRWKGEDNG